jgi:hypothetical protein
MLNKYAAEFAAKELRKSNEGDAIGRQSVIDQLELIAAEKWIVVPADSGLVETEKARQIIACAYSLLRRADACAIERKGAMKQAMEYIEETCDWLDKYC